MTCEFDGMEPPPEPPEAFVRAWAAAGEAMYQGARVVAATALLAGLVVAIGTLGVAAAIVGALKPGPGLGYGADHGI